MTTTALLAKTHWRASRYECSECNRALKYPPVGPHGMCMPCGKRYTVNPMMRTLAEERAARRALPSGVYTLRTPVAGICLKCGGLAVREHLSDMADSADIEQNRCIICGRRW